MKKFLLLFLVMVVLSVTVAAQPMGYELKVSYDASDNGVLSELYVSEGDSVVAHVGFVYNTSKLELVKTIVAENSFKDFDLSKYDDEIQNVLRFYLINRDMAKDMVL